MAMIGADAPSASLQARFDRQVDSWRNELINFTRRNKLLNFKHSRSSSLELSRPIVHRDRPATRHGIVGVLLASRRRRRRRPSRRIPDVSW